MGMVRRGEKRRDLDVLIIQTHVPSGHYKRKKENKNKKNVRYSRAPGSPTSWTEMKKMGFRQSGFWSLYRPRGKR